MKRCQWESMFCVCLCSYSIYLDHDNSPDLDPLVCVYELHIKQPADLLWKIFWSLHVPHI